MSKWYEHTSHSEATGLESWVRVPKIPLKGSKSGKIHWELEFIYDGFSRIFQTPKNMVFKIWVIMIINEVMWDKSTFTLLVVVVLFWKGVFCPLLKTCVKCISVTHHGNQRSISPRIMFGCEVSGGILNTDSWCQYRQCDLFLSRPWFFKYGQQGGLKIYIAKETSKFPKFNIFIYNELSKTV